MGIKYVDQVGKHCMKYCYFACGHTDTGKWSVTVVHGLESPCLRWMKCKERRALRQISITFHPYISSLQIAAVMAGVQMRIRIERQ